MKNAIAGFGYTFGLTLGFFAAIWTVSAISNKMSKKFPEIFQ